MAMAAEPPLGADEIWAAETLLMLSLGHLRRPPPTTLPVTAATTPKPTTTADVRIKKIRFTFSGRPPLPYVCDVCGDSFPSHQALGGHKTRHRPKTSAAAAASSAANNQGHKRKQYEGMMVSAEKTKRRNIDVGDLKRQERAKVLDFNLNLPYIQID